LEKEMTLHARLTATGLLALLSTGIAAAHDPDAMNARFPVQHNKATTPVTCTELAASDRTKLDFSNAKIKALDKHCKAEAAKAKAAKATQNGKPD
jgi:methionine-rich copper-binding protein CopC